MFQPPHPFPALLYQRQALHNEPTCWGWQKCTDSLKGALCNNMKQFTGINHFLIGHSWVECNVMWKIGPSPSPSLLVDYTSLWTGCWSCLMLLHCGFHCEALGLDFPQQSKQCEFTPDLTWDLMVLYWDVTLELIQVLLVLASHSTLDLLVWTWSWFWTSHGTCYVTWDLSISTWDLFLPRLPQYLSALLAEGNNC